MKTINLYLDMEFTSLSPNAQPISIGIESSNCNAAVAFVSDSRDIAKREAKKAGYSWLDDNCAIVNRPEHLKGYVFSKIIVVTPILDELADAVYIAERTQMVDSIATNSFYAEFTDFNINRCDDWVKNNIVSKLKHYPKNVLPTYGEKNFNLEASGDTPLIKIWLKRWLEQFSDYQIQIIVDCGTWDWYHFIQLIAEWHTTPYALKISEDDIIKAFGSIDEFVKQWENAEKPIFPSALKHETLSNLSTGLPKLPDNISPIPFDLNDLIAIKKGISPKKAFDLHREELATNIPDIKYNLDGNMLLDDGTIALKHNALFDAKIIKMLYNKLNH